MAIGGEARSTFLAIIKGDASQAVSEFKKLGNNVSKEVAGAEGSVGKFQSFTNKAMAEFKQNAGMYLAGAGVAVGAFVLKATSDFAALGVEVGKFSTATGLSEEASSRWIEVAGDVGISAGTLETSIGKLNKTINPKLFADMGIEIAKTDTGATDINGTFLNVIDRLNGIKDPAERAKMATKLLGKGWQDMAELIGLGSTTLKESLAGVSDAKVFDAAEVEKARKYREAMDNLRDAFEDFTLKVGEAAIPAITAVTGVVTDMLPWVEKAIAAWTRLSEAIALVTPLGMVQRAMDETTRSSKISSVSLEELTAIMQKQGLSAAEQQTAIAQWHKEMGDASPTVQQLSKDVRDDAAAMWEAKQATTDFTAAYDELIGRLDIEDAWANLDRKLWALRDGTGDTAQETRDYTRDLAEMVTKLDSIPAEVKAKLIAELDAGNIDAVQRYFDGLRAGVQVPVYIKPPPGKQTILPGAAYASGTDSAKRGLALVGENGPELVFMRGGEAVANSANTRQMLTPNLAPANMPGASDVTNNITINTVLDTRQVVEVIKRYTNRGGVL